MKCTACGGDQFYNNHGATFCCDCRTAQPVCEHCLKSYGNHDYEDRCYPEAGSRRYKPKVKVGPICGACLEPLSKHYHLACPYQTGEYTTEPTSYAFQKWLKSRHKYFLHYELEQWRISHGHKERRND